METKTNDYLEKEKLGRLMLQYSGPCIISLLVAALYNIVDQIFIANASYLGSYGNSANTVVYPLTVVALAIAVTFGDGATAFFSICMGSRQKETAEKSVASAVLSSAAFGILLLIIYLAFQETILTMFGARVNDETFRLSKEYFFWISVGIPFYMVGQTITPIISADGSPRYSMGAMLTGACLNIILDPLFIYVFHLGMKGAAIATITGQIVSCLLTMRYLMHMKSVKITAKNMRIRTSVLKKIVPLGMTSFFAQISIVLSMAAVLNMVTVQSALHPIFGQQEYSQIPTAVIGIVMKFFQIVISVSIGLSAGSIPITGYNIGARRNDRVLGLMRLLITAEVIVGAVAMLIFELFPYQLTALFGAANESVYYTDFAVLTIRLFLSMIILSCLNKGATIFMQSLGKARISTGISVLREIVFGVGLPILLGSLFGLYGILFFMPTADILTAVVTITFLKKTYNELKTAPQAEPAIHPAAVTRDAKALTDHIITIGRSYGAGARSVGRLLADSLQIPYYDASILEETAKQSGLNTKFLASIDEKPIESSMLYQYSGFSSHQYTAIEGYANQAQREIIERVASEGPCVIVGRRADQILKDRPNVLSIFITASIEARAKRISERDHLSELDSFKKIAKVDRERAAYYNQHSDKVWGEAATYDLCVDTDRFGIEGAAGMIRAVILKMAPAQ